MSSNWCTIESDPGVFTELIEKLGAQNVQVEELFALDDDSFAQIQPAFGLMFLFKYTEDTPKHRTPGVGPVHPDLFYAKQVITNACGTQALLSILLNSTPQVEIGNELEMFKDFTREFDWEMKGYTLGENELIRENHNAFARPEPFQLDGAGAHDSRTNKRRDDEEDNEAYHFIAYVPFQGGLYELDGLNPAGPVLLQSNVEFDTWLSAVRPHIEARIAKYSSTEIHFNLMALIRDRRVLLRKQCATEELEFEEAKRKQWMEENVRRKHNYVPFLVSALRMLAEKDELQALERAAKDKEANKRV